MDIFFAIVGSLCVSSIVTAILMKMSYDSKMTQHEEKVEEKYTKIYSKKEEQLKAYYEDLLTKEQAKCKESIIKVIEKYDKRVAEINETSNREVEIVKLLMKHLQHKH